MLRFEKQAKSSQRGMHTSIRCSRKRTRMRATTNSNTMREDQDQQRKDARLNNTLFQHIDQTLVDQQYMIQFFMQQLFLQL
eukprot:m.386736 g.386736  ORF g.386736 m.386736 type:complete len:81 (+) comp153904_c0_seq1:63-305(+)